MSFALRACARSLGFLMFYMWLPLLTSLYFRNVTEVVSNKFKKNFLEYGGHYKKLHV